MDFPERIYTDDEVKKAKELVDKGYRHNLLIRGSPHFRHKVKLALELIKTADCYDFFRTFIRSIIEIDGLTQLRESDAAIWANKYAIENPVDGASLLIQKASTMKEYLDGVIYYGGVAEKRSVEKRIGFLRLLKSKSNDTKVVTECERLLDHWREGSLVY